MWPHSEYAEIAYVSIRRILSFSRSEKRQELLNINLFEGGAFEPKVISVIV